MEDLYDIPLFDEHELFALLPDYQKERIQGILENSNYDYLLAADIWLNASISNLTPMGGSGKPNNFREAIEAELRKYLCGHASYKKDRNEFLKLGNQGKLLLVSWLTTTISATLGTAAAIVAPIIILLLIAISKITLNAWCAMA